MADNTLRNSVIVFNDPADVVISDVLDVHFDGSAVIIAEVTAPVANLADTGGDLVHDVLALVHNEIRVGSAASEAAAIQVHKEVFGVP